MKSRSFLRDLPIRFRSWIYRSPVSPEFSEGAAVRLKKIWHIILRPFASEHRDDREWGIWVGFFLFIAGIGLIFFPILYRMYVSHAETEYRVNLSSGPASATSSASLPYGTIRIDPHLLSFSEAPQPPQRIVIPDLKVDLPVVEARVVNGYWETSETKASHGIGSANPGEPGNTVIFAHARDGLFLPLRNVTKGTRVYVMTKDRWYGYSIEAVKLVTPDQVQTIGQTEDERLTLFTCSGFLDSKRVIAVGKPL